MFCFSLKSIILIAGIVVAFGQNDKFEYECDILTRLDYLENELKETKDTLAITETKLAALNSTLRADSILQETANPGSTYIRWGRTNCPGHGDELVYSGLAGGAFFNQGGAGANYICLPKTPIYGKYTEDAVQGGGYVYGVEYDFIHRANRMAFFPDLVDRTDLLNNDVPCAVCRTYRSTMLMVPARNTCMEGWTLEYKGLLVGQSSIHASSDYICLDDQPEYIQGGGENKDGKVLYFVESRCGSLPCPPYVDGRELSCAVCTK